MSKKMGVKVLFALGFCLLGVILFTHKNYSLAPVEGCDKPLIEFSLNQYEFTRRFKCQYKGCYQMRIKNVEINSLWEADAFINIQIESASGKQIVYYKPEMIKVEYKDGCHYHYIDFTVPDMIPLNKELLLKIQVSGDSKRFFEINPNIHFEIEKEQ